MRKLLAVVTLLMLVAQPTPAQQEYRISLPYVANKTCNYQGGGMSTWKIVVPEATINYCLNPSAEIAGNFNAVGGGTMTAVNTYQFFDVWSYRIQTAANNQGGRIGLQALPNAIHYVTVRVRGTLPAAWDWSLDDAAYTAPVLLEAIDGDWSLYGLQFPAAQAVGATFFYIRQNGAGAGDFYVDGVQVEQKTGYWTTFCDGTREGCEWNGAAHASSSQRSAQSRAGGRVQDLQDDYWLNVSGFIGTGLPPITNTVDSYAILPGGELNAIKVQSRIFTLPGTLSGTSTSNLHARRQDLLNVLKPNAVPEDASGPQPVRLRYTGATVQKQIAVHYEAGLETSIDATLECWERVAIRFLADDPYWYEIGDSADVLDSNDNATLRHIAARLRATGLWDDLNTAANPTVFNSIDAIAVGPDGIIYVGGDFTGWNNQAGRDYIAQYNPQTDTWANVGPGGTFNGAVFALAFAPNGDLYAGGAFQNVGGGAGDYVAYWNGANWIPVAAGGTPNVYSLTFGLDGTLYIGGNFINWAGLGVNGIVSWNGVAYVAIGTMAGGIPTSDVNSLATAPNGNIVAGGDFVTAGGVTVNDIAEWNGTAWSALGNGFNLDVNVVAVAGDGTVYAGGSFTQDGAAVVTLSYIARWNGTAWSQLGTGLNNICFEVELAPDNMLYAGGTFTSAGGITLADRVAKWNGASWAQLDVDLPGAPSVTALAVGPADPVIPTNYDVWVGFSTTGLGNFADDLTMANDGTERAFPKFVISRIGGTSAVLEEIRNETTGLELLFDYRLLDGETLTIDLTPTNKSVASNFFGPRLDAVLANSDFGAFSLLPGNNLITCFIDIGGNPTINAFVQWDDKYWSQD